VHVVGACYGRLLHSFLLLLRGTTSKMISGWQTRRFRLARKHTGILQAGAARAAAARRASGERARVVAVVAVRESY
jgi:hypothetical protein